MTELMGIAGADELGEEVHPIGQYEHEDGEDPGDQQQDAVVHRGEELEELGAELGVAEADRIRRQGEKGEDGGDAQDLEQPLGKRESGDDQELLPAIGSGEDIDFPNEVGGVMEEAGQGRLGRRLKRQGAEGAEEEKRD